MKSTDFNLLDLNAPGSMAVSLGDKVKFVMLLDWKAWYPTLTNWLNPDKSNSVIELPWKLYVPNELSGIFPNLSVLIKLLWNAPPYVPSPYIYVSLEQPDKSNEVNLLLWKAPELMYTKLVDAVKFTLEIEFERNACCSILFKYLLKVTLVILLL